METPETDRFRQTIRASLKRIDPLMDDDAIDGHDIMCAFDMAVAMLCRHIVELEQTLAEAREEIEDLESCVGDAGNGELSDLCACGHVWDDETIQSWQGALAEMRRNVGNDFNGVVDAVCPTCKKNTRILVE